MKTYLFVALVLLNVAGSGHVVAETIWVRGAGQDSCGNWTAYRTGEQTMEKGTYMVAETNWILGYVSALQKPNSPGANVDNGGLWAWIDNYCAQHPLDSVASAATALVAALK